LKKIYISVVFAFITITNLNAQSYVHDLGVHSGLSMFQTDYGERNNFLSSYGNAGFSFSLTHTLHFFNISNRWNASNHLFTHLALRSEANFTSANLVHFGRYVEGQGELATKLNAMTGKVSTSNFGTQLEIYLFSMRDYMYNYNNKKWNLYGLFGVHYTGYKNELNSTLGDWTQNPTVLPTKWQPDDAKFIGNNGTVSITAGGGVRKKLNDMIDFNLQFNWRWFGTDYLDGLNADVQENQNKDWLINIQLGLIYHLNLFN